MVKIGRISGDETVGQIEHAEATRQEASLSLELALSNRGPWRGKEQCSVIATATALKRLQRLWLGEIRLGTYRS